MRAEAEVEQALSILESLLRCSPSEAYRVTEFVHCQLDVLKWCNGENGGEFAKLLAALKTPTESDKTLDEIL